MSKFRITQRPDWAAHIALGIVLGSTITTAIVFLAGGVR